MSIDFQPPGSGGSTATSVDVTSFGYTTEMDYDANGNVIYYGIAAPGTAVGSAAWQIRKLDYSGTGNLLDMLYANGSRAFASAWTNRVALAYS